jgi:hypothetical protein
VCSQFPIFVDYVESTIFGPVKEKVVNAWTKPCMHMGYTTTNRVESTHARLKKYIQNSQRDICKNWECISQMLGCGMCGCRVMLICDSTHHYYVNLLG